MAVEIDMRTLAIHHAPCAIELHERVVYKQTRSDESNIGTDKT
jgi:hypothetical protein